MDKKLKFIVLLFLVMMMIFTIGCVKRQVVLTPDQEANRAYFEAKDQHTEALKIFTKGLIKYNTWCEKAEYKEACSKIDPYVYEANKALNAWGAVVESRKDDTASNENYVDELKALKSKLLQEAPGYIW
jgi:hypothetical protein